MLVPREPFGLARVLICCSGRPALSSGRPESVRGTAETDRCARELGGARGSGISSKPLWISNKPPGGRSAV
jgi:hypothetical protein